MNEASSPGPGNACGRDHTEEKKVSKRGVQVSAGYSDECVGVVTGIG